jgi:hypothetical protein
MRGAWLVGLAACAHVEPVVREGPPFHVGFGPPPGLAQLEIARQERTSEVRFAGKDPVKVREEIRTRQREAWKPVKGGGWRLTAMLLDEEATRDGVPMGSAVPLRGVPFTHRIDADGRFVTAEDVRETVQTIEALTPSKELRRMLEPLLTPSLVAGRMEASWRRRTEGLCGRDFVPGAVFFGIDRQELPVGGPALSLVRAQVLGQAFDGTLAVMELSLTFAGADAPMTREAGAGAVLGELGPNETLATHADGHGRRLVALSSCQVVAEESEVDGQWTARPDAAESVEAGAVPKSIRFHVRRAARRTTGPEARAAEPMP